MENARTEQAKSLAALKSVSTVYVKEKNSKGQEVMSFELVWSLQFQETTKSHAEVKRCTLKCNESWALAQAGKFTRGVCAECLSGLEQSLTRSVRLSALGEDASPKLIRQCWSWCCKSSSMASFGSYNMGAKVSLTGGNCVLPGALWQYLAVSVDGESERA